MRHHSKSLLLVSSLALITVLPGCATLTRGTSEAFVVNTIPSGAHVQLSTGQSCTTPCTLNESRKSSFALVIEKPGYKSVATRVVSEMDTRGATSMAGNALLANPIGIGIVTGVDMLSGATKKLTPNPLSVVLENADSRSEPAHQQVGQSTPAQGTGGNGAPAQNSPVQNGQPTATAQTQSAQPASLQTAGNPQPVTKQGG